MRESELLNALAQGDGGIRIKMTKKGVTVATRYTPRVKGKGKTLFAAAFACAQQVLDAVKKRPRFPPLCPDVIVALEKYDQHTEMISR